MTLDYNFLQSMLTIVTFLVGGIIFVITNRASIEYLANRMSNVESELRKLAEVLITIGRQDERINALYRTVEELRKGKGLIVQHTKHRE